MKRIWLFSDRHYKTLTGHTGWEWMVFLGLAVIFLWCVAGSLTAPTWTQLDSWRESDTYAVAVNFYRDGLDIFHPRFNYDGVDGMTVQLELPVLPFLSAMGFRLLGQESVVVCRALSLLFFLGAAGMVFALARMLVRPVPALGAAAVFLFLPISMQYARAIMPEALALLLYTGSMYFLMRWHRGGKDALLWWSAALMALGIMQKPPVAFAGLAVLYLFWVHYGGWRALRSIWVYGYGAVSLLIPAAYYIFSYFQAQARFVSGIAAKHIFTSEILSIFTQQAWTFFRKNIDFSFGWLVILCGVLGILAAWKARGRFVLIWAGAFVLEWALIVAVIRFDYYLIFMLAPLALLCGYAFDWFYDQNHLACTAVILLITVPSAITSAERLGQVCAPVEDMADAIRLIELVTPAGDALAVADANPVYLNATGRFGYRAGIQYYPEIPQQPAQEISYYRDRGIRWLVAPQGSVPNDRDGSYWQYLCRTFPMVARSGTCVIFRLDGGDAA